VVYRSAAESRELARRRLVEGPEGEPSPAESGSLGYTSPMNFLWDEVKSDTCFRERGFDFAYAASAFADPDRVIRQDTRYTYGEVRYQLIGRVAGRLFFIVYTPRSDGIRIISARKANSREVQRYENRSNEDRR